MTDLDVTRIWSTTACDPSELALLAAVCLHARDGATTETIATLASTAGLSARSVHTWLPILAAKGILATTTRRSPDGRRQAATRITLTLPDTTKHLTAKMSGSQLQPDNCSQLGNFDASRVGPAFAFRVGGLRAVQRVVLASMAMLADVRGVVLASREVLASWSGVSVSTLARVMRGLEDDGWITRQPRRAGARATDGRIALSQAFIAAGRPHDPVVSETRRPRRRVVAGVESDDRWVRMITDAAAEGWQGDAAAQIAEMIHQWLADGPGRSIVRRRYEVVATQGWGVAHADTMSLAWEAVRDHAGRLVAADHPERLLHRIVSLAAGQHDLEMHGDRDDPHGRVIPLDHESLPEEPVALDESVTMTETIGVDDLADAPLVTGLVDDLAARGVAASVSWPVLARCAEIVVGIGSSRRHTAARRDYLLAGLGLTPDQAAAWMSLLVGTRKRGMEASALLNDGDLELVPPNWVRLITDAA